jgi:hypothetical protein
MEIMGVRRLFSRGGQNFWGGGGCPPLRTLKYSGHQLVGVRITLGEYKE